MSTSPIKALGLCFGIFLGTACVSTQTDPWYAEHEQRGASTRKGTRRLAMPAGVATGYQVDSTIKIVNANFGSDTHLTGDMIGRFGLGLRGEYFVADDWMLFLGGEQRIFKPDLGDDLITFGEASQIEFSVGSRYYLPWRMLDNRRLRGYLQTKLAYIPKVEFEMTSRLPFDPPLEDGILISQFEGSSYWSLAAGGGLSYELNKDWLVSLGFFYEWPLSTSDGVTGAELAQTTGNAFVDDILRALEYDVELQPEGWIAFLTMTYRF